MENSHERYLKAFYEKLLELKNKEEQKALSQQELKDIAFELGFSDNEWHLIEEKVEGHLKNGQSFLGFQNWRDAIKEFEQALQLSPNNLAATYGLAIAFHSLYQEDTQNVFKEKALQYARIRLKNEPGHEPSIRIISELQKESKTAFKQANAYAVNKVQATSTTNNPRIILMASMAMIGIFIAGIIAFSVMRKQSKKTKYKPKSNYTPGNHNNSRNNAPNQAPVNNHSFDVAPTQSQIPTKFVKTPAGQGIALWSIDKSKASPSRHRFYYKLVGNLKVEEGAPISELNLKVEFINQEDRVAMAEFVTVLRRYQPIAIKGDYIPFYLSKSKSGYTLGDFKEIRLSVHTIKRASTPKTLSNKIVPVIWAYDPPRGVELEVRERQQTVRGYSHSTSHKVELNFINKSKQAIKTLKVEAQWINHNNEIIHSMIRTLVYKHQASLRPEHNRRHRFNAYLKNVTPQQVKEYKINIIDAEVK